MWLLTTLRGTIASVVALKQWTVSEIWNDHLSVTSVTAAQTDITSPTDRND